MTYGGKTIHSGILDDADSVAITDFDGGVLYKVTLKDTGYICERSEASTIVTINTDSQLNSNDVFFLDFNYTSGTINTGIEMQINYNGVMSTASYIYDTNNKRVTIAETNRMYLIKKRIDGFYMMKIG